MSTQPPTCVYTMHQHSDCNVLKGSAKVGMVTNHAVYKCGIPQGLASIFAMMMSNLASEYITEHS